MTFIRLRTYAALSVLVTTVLVAYSSSQYQQFYPIVVNLVNSKLSRLVLINDAILFVILFGRLLKTIFLGKLRTSEEETTWEKSYVTLIETCLALTIFRDELSSRVFATFVLCLFVKVFHWISQLRVKFIESQTHTDKTTFVRLYSLLSLLLVLDLTFSKLYLDHFWDNGATVKVLFLTEYSIMAIISLTTWVRLTLHAVNLYKQSQNRVERPADAEEDDDDVEVPGWEGHERALFYLDIASDLLQSFIYILFFVVIMLKYGLPIHLLRDIYIAIHSVFKRINDLIHYRRLVTNLDQRFPDATEQDLAGNDICVVCRNEMRPGQRSVKKLPCGHMFHSQCLRGWLERGQSCPTCIAPVDPDEYERYLRERGETRPHRHDATPVPPQVDEHQAQIDQLQQQLAQQYNLVLESLQNTPMTAQEEPTPFDQALLNNALLQQQLNIPSQNPLQHFHNMVNNMVPENGFGNRGSDAIMKEMYINYLEHLRGLIDTTLVKLKEQEEDVE